MVDDSGEIMKKKIIFINSWPLSIATGGGAAFFTKGLYTQLKKNGEDVKKITLDNSFKNYHLYLIKRIFFNILLNFRIKFYNEIVLGFDFDGFCLSRKNNYFITLPRGIFADIAPYEKGLYYLSLKIQAFLEKINLRRANAVIVSSQYAKKKVVELYKINAYKVMVIPNGFDLDMWKKHLSIQPLEKKSKKRILGVAKFYPRKKMEVLVKAFALVLKKNKGVELILVGNGIELPKLKELVKELEIEECVTFYGNVPERAKMASIYKNCDIFCHPSIQENFSNVLLEAMASSKPIVAARAASMPEIVKDRISGLLFTPNNSEDLAEKLLELLNNDSSRIKLGEEGYNLLINNYLWEDKIKIFIDFFETIVSNSSGNRK